MLSDLTLGKSDAGKSSFIQRSKRRGSNSKRHFLPEVAVQKNSRKFTSGTRPLGSMLLMHTVNRHTHLYMHAVVSIMHSNLATNHCGESSTGAVTFECNHRYFPVFIFTFSCINLYWFVAYGWTQEYTVEWEEEYFIHKCCWTCPLLCTNICFIANLRQPESLAALNTDFRVTWMAAFRTDYMWVSIFWCTNSSPHIAAISKYLHLRSYKHCKHP